MNIKKSAFSLIELSIVILVIGILIAGVSQGSRLIYANRLSVAQSITASSPVNSMPNLVLWLETSAEGSFDSTVENNSAISNWYEVNNQQTNSKITYSQSNSSYKPLYVKNGIGFLPSVYFDGSNDALNASNIYMSSPNYTAFIVFNTVTNGGSPRHLLSIYNDPDTDFTNSTAKPGLTFELWNSSSPPPLRLLYRSPMGSSGGDIPLSTATVSDNVNYIMSNVRNYQTSTLTAWMNNTAYIGGGATSPTVAVGAFDIAPPYSSTIGRQVDNLTTMRPYKGLISEIILFDRALKQAEIDDIESYLSKKYQIPLS